ncbi:hypothetical protein HTZ84_21160 [Haloterrigena sp. SYSU A558-1]|uniref:Uncharacterized protein n=1 Tax=Haloterrigena gelatinilytica TaxID=2741724 RepID=A0ABX2LJM8_9EURY|nr:hypothetical protein [Haloterrigena gelatinilytica]NUC74775.1 hypothetical protein [Haloterrigena gelatinilytica]
MGSKSSTESWIAGQLREKLVSPNNDLPTLQEAGLLDKEVIDFLVAFEENYQPQDLDDPHYAHETERYQRIVKKNVSKNLRRAIRDGDKEVIAHALGVVEQTTSISPIKLIERLRRWIVREAGVTYLAGHMGVGKTDFSLLLGEIWESNTEGEVASNIKSCKQTKTIVRQDDLTDWLESGSGDKLFIFDEASSHATGYSHDASVVVKQLSSMIKLIRKNDGSIIIIGHTGKDLHPDIRRLADYVEKESKKELAVFETVEEAEGQDEKFDLDGIPPTSWTYDTKEASSWEWATDEEDEGPDLLEIACKVYINSNMNQRDVADLFEMSASQISQNYQQYK